MSDLCVQICPGAPRHRCRGMANEVLHAAHEARAPEGPEGVQHSYGKNWEDIGRFSGRYVKISGLLKAI